MIEQGVEYLAAHDPVLAQLIAHHEPPRLTPHRDYYRALVDAIIGQQLSVKAAAAIRRRFRALFGETFPTPTQTLALDPDTLRSCGLSRTKVSCIRDLSEHVLAHQVTLDQFENLTNDEIIRELTAVKGIGEWTVHMFLMFCMGRLDVLALGDLGVRAGAQRAYDLPTFPTPKEVIALAQRNHWHPYETLACHYMWSLLGNKPA